MGSYASFLANLNRFHYNPLRVYDAFNDLYNSVHGGERFFWSQTPIGKIRQFSDEYERWNDSYNNTGIDPRYSSRYGSAGIPFVNDAIGSAFKPIRMARSLVSMYGAEVELKIASTKLKTARQYERNAIEWQNYQAMKNKK